MSAEVSTIPAPGLIGTQLLPHQGQERRIRQLVEKSAGGVHQQRAAQQEGHPALRRFCVAFAWFEPAGASEIDFGVGDGHRRNCGECRNHRHLQEHPSRRKPPRNKTRQDRGRDVPGARPSGVASHAGGQYLARAQADRQRRHCRFEHTTDHLHRSIGQQHRPEAWKNGDDDGTDRQPQQSPEHGGTFAIGAIEPGADRCLHRQAEPSAHCADQPGHGRAPTLLGSQKDNDIGAQPAANVGDQEVQPVERRGTKVLRPEPLAYVTTAFSYGLSAPTEPGLPPVWMVFVACHFERAPRKPQSLDSWHAFLKPPRLPERGDQPFRHGIPEAASARGS